jgi:peptidoglycan/LPS O-acetylase OafA/YrhL
MTNATFIEASRLATEPSEIAAEAHSEYFPAFDYLRFVLAAAVVAFHANMFSWERAGNFSVQMFFALSGWLIGGMLLSVDAKSLPRFYFNRAARIWIPYFVTVMLLILAYLVFSVITAKWIELTFYKFTFVYNFFGARQIVEHHAASTVQWVGNHLWSICAEEQFYLVAPIFIVLLPIGRSVWFWAALSAILLSSPIADFFGAISLGVSAAIIQKHHFPDWHRHPYSIAALASSAGLLFLATYLDLVPYQAGSAFVAIFAVLAFAQPGKRPSRLARFLGGMSYSLYLNQWIGIWLATVLVRRFGISNIAFQCSAVVISFVVAAALYVIVDRTIHNHRSRYFTEARGRALAITGYALVIIGSIVGVGFLGDW